MSEHRDITNIDLAFEENGYKISDGHFELGRTVHSDTYYFVKKYFQITDCCRKTSVLLQKKLADKFELNAGTTLLGFGNHTALLLDMVVRERPYMNYAILEKAENSFAFQSIPELRKNVIIILPISCTCSTFFKIEKFLKAYREKNRLKFEVLKDFVTIFLLLDEQLAPQDNTINIKKETGRPGAGAQLYRNYGWLTIDKDSVEIRGAARSHYLKLLKAKLSLPEDCPSCFPECADAQMSAEKFLFSTHPAYETPQLIFGVPQFTKEQDEQNSFSKVMHFSGKERNPHLYGNIHIDGTSFLSYIRGNIFYQNNRGDILRFFNDRLTSLLQNDGEILIITSDNRHSSNFLEDLINQDCLTGKRITILRYRPFQEFVDNFISIYRPIISGNIKIVYFEDVLSGGRTFKLISDYIKHTVAGTARRQSFDLLLTLVDRTSSFTRQEILRKLSGGSNNDKEFIRFFQLNAPVTGNAHLGDPLKEYYSRLKRIIVECHLDALKKNVIKELIRNRPQSLSEISTQYDTDTNTYLYIPLPEDCDKEVFVFYKPFFTPQKLEYVKLYLTHEINRVLAMPDNSKEPDLMKKLMDNIRNPLSEILTSDGETDKNRLRQPDFEQKVINNIVLSILSKPPFIHYERVYKSAFRYCIDQLEELYGQTKGKTTDSYDFIRLRMLVKRSVELNSNYIISERFLGYVKQQLKQDIVQEYVREYREAYIQSSHTDGEYCDIYRTNLDYKYRQAISYTYFLLYCFKVLIFRNPSRSIVLENLISKPPLLPAKIPYSNHDTSSANPDDLRQIIRDPYYLFNRILKAENIYLLNELKEYHKEVNRNETNNEPDEKKNVTETGGISKDQNNQIVPEQKREDHLELLKQSYFTNKNNPVIKNAQKLVDQSTHAGRKEHVYIKNAVCEMLHTVTQLENLKHKKIASGDIDTEIKNILNSVVEIMRQGIEGELGYAFFIEYKESQPGEYNLYSVLSDNIAALDDSTTLRLSKDGLIYNALYELTDTIDNTNPQTLLFAGRLPDGSICSFQDYYYMPAGRPKANTHRRYARYFNPDDDYLRRQALNFEQMFYADHWNSETRTGLKAMKNVNMALVFRMSNVLTPSNGAEYKLKGQAVLVITTTLETNISNFFNFMNIEKIRLLLLIKEELLAYIHKLFDNDAFIEVLEHRKRKIYQHKLEHGISRYLLMQRELLEDILQETDEKKNRRNRVLLDIINNAIDGQITIKKDYIKRLEKNNRYFENFFNDAVYKTKALIELFRDIFECKHFHECISFENVKCIGFESEEITIKKAIIDIVIPEIIYNMKKYSSSIYPDRFTIEFNAADNKLIFRNNVIKIARQHTEKNYGGIDMCREITAGLGYQPMEDYYDDKENIYITIIKLNLVGYENTHT